MLPLATTTWDDDEYAALQTVINSGMFTMGSQVVEFEQAFARYMGSSYGVMVNSGSSANLLAVATLFYRQHGAALKSGDEVIVPSISWSTTYTPLQQYGLRLKFVDVDPDTLNFDLTQLEEAVSNTTKAIFVVNLLGNPNDFAKINTIIADRDIVIIEDNCESMGAQFANRYTGTYGLMGTFSTFFSHHISTMEGGVILTDDEEVYHILLALRSHGWTRHLPEKNWVCEKSSYPFDESFRFVLPGYNVRPLELSGAVGLKQLEKLPDLIFGRRKNAEIFQNLFRDITHVRTQREIGLSSWFGFSIVLEHSSMQRRKLIRALADKGIECRPIVAGNFLRNPVIQYFNYTVHGDLKSADYVSDNGFFIGNHHYNISAQLATVADIIKSFA